MGNFSDFKKVFDNHYGSIVDFIEKYEELEGLGPCPFNYTEIANLDVEGNDSYGNDDTTLSRVYFIADYSIFVMFTGARQSYSGSDWYDYKEVTQKTKTIKVWE